MILRLLINLVRLSWGYGPYVAPDEINENVELIMLIGSMLDLAAVAVAVGLFLTALHAMRRKK